MCTHHSEVRGEISYNMLFPAPLIIGDKQFSENAFKKDSCKGNTF